MKETYTFKHLFFFCFFLIFSGVLSAQTINNAKYEYSCPCRVKVTYDLAKRGDVVLYYSPDTTGNFWLPADTFPTRSVGPHTDIWNCEADSVVYGLFHFKLERLLTPCEKKGGEMINGVCWATRNVDAHGEFVENPEDYGALFQWGRAGDGHEQPTSQRYPIDNNTNQAGQVSGAANFDAYDQIVSGHAAYGKFIKQNTTPFNWRDPSISTLWNSGTDGAPVKTPNDPSPTGYRVPTYAEILSLTTATRVTCNWTTENFVYGIRFTDTGADGRGNSGNSIFLPAAGCRDTSNGAFFQVGALCYYWSSRDTNDSTAILLEYSLGLGWGTRIVSYAKGHGVSIRPVVE